MKAQADSTNAQEGDASRFKVPPNSNAQTNSNQSASGATTSGTSANNGAGGQNTNRVYTQAELDELTKTELEYYQKKDSNLPSPMVDEAFYGVAGKIVGIIEAQSEASREGLLAHLLVGLGNILGGGVRVRQAVWHYLNEFCVLIGETAFGRKGTAWAALEDLFERIDLSWLANRVSGGFQSGESIVHEIRDPQLVMSGKRKINDPGVTDKRLLIFEEEFGRLLNVANRQGNTLSETIRQAWDSRRWLTVKGKIAPEKATEPHISLIGHITKDELLKSLKELENQNGFSNRILWIATYRAKIIPEPEPIDWQKTHPKIVDYLNHLVQSFGSGIRRELRWSKNGKVAWENFYASLKSPKGTIGASPDALRRMSCV
jgi:hypothetical protein